MPKSLLEKSYPYLAAFLTYFIAAQVGLNSGVGDGPVSVVWPATGVAMATLWLKGLPLWPAIALAEFVSAMMSGWGPATAALSTIGNTGDAVCGVLLLRRLGFVGEFRPVSDVLRFASAPVLACAISATIGVLGLALTGVIPWTELRMQWADWWASAVVGALVMMPVLLTGWSREGWVLPRAKTVEMLAYTVVSSIGFYATVVAPAFADGSHGHAFFILAIFVLLWPALRFGLHWTTAMTLTLCAAVVIVTRAGIGPFVLGEPQQALLLLQVFLAAVSLAALVVSAALRERDHALERLRHDMAARQSAELALIEREALFRSIFTTVNTAVVFTTVDGAVLAANPEAEALFGVPASQLSTQKTMDFYANPADRNRLIEKFRRDGGVRDEEVQLRASDGRVFRASVSLQPTIWHGTPAMVGSVFDITDRHQAAEALRHAKEAAEAGARAKANFLATMSHELRTPLNAILGFSEVLRMDEISPARDNPAKVKEYSTLIHRAGSDLLSLINDLLDLSKIEAGKFVLSSENILVDEVVEDCLTAIRHHPNGSTVDLSCQAGVPNRVLHGDSRRFRQILLNLLSNAVKFTLPGGSVAVQIDESNGTVRVIVRDTGIGMTAEEVEKALTPFGRADNPLTRAREGTGLGLPLASQLARQMGGTLHLESEPNQGTTAVLELPVGQPRHQSETGAARVPAPVGG